MNCPRCGRPLEFGGSGYHAGDDIRCGHCGYKRYLYASRPEINLNEISRLTAELADANGAANIYRDALSEKAADFELLRADLKAKDEELSTLRKQVEEAAGIIAKVDYWFWPEADKAGLDNWLESYRLNHPAQKGE